MAGSAGAELVEIGAIGVAVVVGAYVVKSLFAAGNLSTPVADAGASLAGNVPASRVAAIDHDTVIGTIAAGGTPKDATDSEQQVNAFLANYWPDQGLGGMFETAFNYWTGKGLAGTAPAAPSTGLDSPGGSEIGS
jgi:hypothetical protein